MPVLGGYFMIDIQDTNKTSGIRFSSFGLQSFEPIPLNLEKHLLGGGGTEGAQYQKNPFLWVKIFSSSPPARGLATALEIEL